jgi:quercetin dioxygenase-like cupin family protein
MSEQLQQVAERLRGLREVEGISAGSLAHELGLPLETYQRYESGESDIPVGVLYEVAGKFGVELTALLTGENPRLHTYALSRAGQGVSVQRRVEYQYQSLAYNFAHKKAEPFLVTVEPDAPEEPVHVNSHPGQEFDYVLSGQVKIVIDGHELILEAGDSVFYDSGVDHGMKALGGQTARFLAVVM